MTLREISVVIDGAVARMKRDRDETIVLAWHIEAFARQKKLPSLEKLLRPQPMPTGEKMSADQIQATLRGWLGSRKKNR